MPLCNISANEQTSNLDPNIVRCQARQGQRIAMCSFPLSSTSHHTRADAWLTIANRICVRTDVHLSIFGVEHLPSARDLLSVISRMVRWYSRYRLYQRQKMPGRCGKSCSGVDLRSAENTSTSPTGSRSRPCHLHPPGLART